MKILVDADACPKPVLQACNRIGQKLAVPVWTVASFHHQIESDHHVLVGDDPQETDLKIMNLTEPGDVVITQDWGLAAVVLGKGAKALSPSGREYCPEKIDFLLEERDVKAKFRQSGGRTKGPRKRTPGENQKFEGSLERLLSKKSGA